MTKQDKSIASKSTAPASIELTDDQLRQAHGGKVEAQRKLKIDQPKGNGAIQGTYPSRS